MNIKQRDKLLLQESYFKLMHLLSPYFAQVVLNRLKDTYISPQLEMAWDIQFFRICTVSSYLINIPCLLLKHFQTCLGSCPCASYFICRNSLLWSFHLSSPFPLTLIKCHLAGKHCTHCLKNFYNHTSTTAFGTPY